MTLVSWSPLREFDDIFERYNRLFARNPAATRESAAVEWRPVANVSETADHYVISAELPAVEKKDVAVTVQEGVITIRGERKFERTDDSERQHRVESFYGSFARSFSLPPDADAQRINAEFRDGMLKVSIPKAEEAKPKTIDVQVR
jgi:HSP20 family protein